MSLLCPLGNRLMSGSLSVAGDVGTLATGEMPPSKPNAGCPLGGVVVPDHASFYGVGNNFGKPVTHKALALFTLSAKISSGRNSSRVADNYVKL